MCRPRSILSFLVSLAVAAGVGGVAGADAERWVGLHRAADDQVLHGQLKDAEGLYRRALRAEDAGPVERTRTWVALAEVYFRQQDAEASRKALSEALVEFEHGDASSSGYAGVAKALSVSLEQAGREGEATRLLEKAAHARLKDAADLLQSAGLLYQRTGNLVAAEAAYQKALAISSPDLRSDSDYRRRLAHSALLKLVQLQVDLGKDAEAIRVIAVALDGADEAAPDLGLIEVLKVYERLLEKSGRTADAQRAEHWRERIVDNVKRQTNAALSAP